MGSKSFLPEWLHLCLLEEKRSKIHNYVSPKGITRRERLKSALYLRLKKRKRLFFEKKLEFFEFLFFQKMSHSAKKCKRGDPLGFINIYSVAKYQKTRKGDSFDTLKNFEKKSHNAEKKLKGGTL